MNHHPAHLWGIHLCVWWWSPGKHSTWSRSHDSQMQIHPYGHPKGTWKQPLWPGLSSGQARPETPKRWSIVSLQVLTRLARAESPDPLVYLLMSLWHVLTAFRSWEYRFCRHSREVQTGGIFCSLIMWPALEALGTLLYLWILCDCFHASSVSGRPYVRLVYLHSNNLNKNCYTWTIILCLWHPRASTCPFTSSASCFALCRVYKS